ncbi:MAG TPA: serine hydrolase domain-containing protein [Blastocatellia bacterium]|nr:serine hydrolase domain-containing protein [Blastocatellia bacterium]
MHRKFTLLFALLLLLSAVTRADKVDDYVKAEMQKQRIPGLSLAVVKDGKIIKAQGYGLANVEHNIPAKPETVYKIASISKQFLAAGILLLAQDGKLRVDDKVSQYLDGTPDTWKNITIRHFLTHTSGVVREAPGFNPFKVQDDFDVIKTAFPAPLQFTTGEKYQYCNVGYFSLAEIIRRVSGKGWDEFLQERVFGPSGMTATRPTSYKVVVPHRAAGYDWNSDTMQNALDYLAMRPSGAFLSTVLDLAKWDAMLYSDKILSAATKEQMWTPMPLNNGTKSPYGFGWELSPLGTHKQIGHGGSLPGFRSHLSRFVDDKLSIIVLTNSGNANPQAVVKGVAALYFPDLATAAKAAGGN